MVIRPISSRFRTVPLALIQSRWESPVPLLPSDSRFWNILEFPRQELQMAHLLVHKRRPQPLRPVEPRPRAMAPIYCWDASPELAAARSVPRLSLEVPVALSLC